MLRQCPRDRSPLHEQRAGRVNVDVCLVCKGTFLDGIELRRVVGDAEIALALANERGVAPEPCACPACGQMMHLDDVDGIQLDHCSFCLGVWLDAGEMERLATRAMSAVARTRAPKLDAVLRDIAAGILRAHE